VAHDKEASTLHHSAPRPRTEVEALNGGIVRFGRETGVPTPLNEAIAALIHGMEKGWET
jgi:2-dehydropantoate 2-reductase